MDVTVYQPPPQPLAASSLTRLGQFPCSEPSLETSKVDGDAMFFSMPDIGLDFASTDQFCAPRPPQDMSKVIPAIPHSHHWRTDTHMAETHQLPWSFSVGGLGDDGCSIPPIAAPNLPQRMLPSHFPNSSPSGLCHPLDPPSSSSHPYWPQATELPDLPASQDGGALLNQDGAMFNPTSTLSVMQQMFNSDSRFTSSHPPMEAALRPGMSQQSHQSINQTQLAISGNSVTLNSPSPPGSKSATPSPSSSAHEDENEDTLRLASGGEKRPAAADLSKKSKTSKKKKRKDPNEPVKPVSAYALFFRDTQASIKAQNPSATFGEVSKVVASMWDGLGDEQKQVYKKRTEVAKKEYLKQLAAYRATLVLQSYNSPSEMKPPHSSPSSTPKPSMYPSHQGQHPTTSSPAHPHCLPYSQHTSMYMTYPHPSQHSHNSSPGLGCQTPPPQNQIQTQLLALSPRGMVPHPSSTPHQGALSLSSITAASTPPLQVSPPVHNHTHSGRLPSPYQQLSGYRLGVTHSPAVIQSHQPIGGAAMCSSMDYRQLSRHTPNHQPSPDWHADYHGNSTLQREKHLYQS